MKTFLILLALLAVALSATANINKPPEYSLLWSGFSSITLHGDYAVVTAPDGIVVLAYDQLAEAYTPTDYLFLDTKPIAQKRNGSVLAVRSVANIIYFIDISNLPNLQLLGEADIGFPFSDYTCFGQDIYIANGFHGLWRYTMVNYGSVSLADSSNIGIHYTKVDVYGDQLFALDDYNGILRYQLTGISFGEFQEYLYVPLQVNNFARLDSTMVLVMKKPKLMLGIHDADQTEITGSYDLFFPGDQVYGVDTVAVAVNAEFNIAEMINIRSGEQYQFTLEQTPDSGMGGEAMIWQGENHLIFPTSDGGLGLYNLDKIKTDPEPVPYFDRPGPIMDLAMYKNQLWTTGTGNPVDIFYLSEEGLPQARETLYPGFPNTTAMSLAGDYVAIMYPRLLHTILMRLYPEPKTLSKAIFVGQEVEGIVFNNEYIDTLRSLFAFTNSNVACYTLSDSGQITKAFDLSVIERVYDIEFFDSLLFVSSGKNKVDIYRVYSDFGVSYRGNFGLPAPGYDLNRYGDTLLVMAGDNMIVIDPALLGDGGTPPSLKLPFLIRDSYVDGSDLAVVGDQGFGLIDLVSNPPKLLDTGTRGGHIISMKNGIVALSNGTVVHLFDTRDIITDVNDPTNSLPEDFSLSQNYPNPFNPSTTISFSLPHRADVLLEIFNVLGQRVIVLENGELPAGNHRVIWMGTDDRGERVASGVYLYRLQADGFVASRKMILMK